MLYSRRNESSGGRQGVTKESRACSYCPGHTMKAAERAPSIIHRKSLNSWGATKLTASSSGPHSWAQTLQLLAITHVYNTKWSCRVKSTVTANPHNQMPQNTPSKWPPCVRRRLNHAADITLSHPLLILEHSPAYSSFIYRFLNRHRHHSPTVLLIIFLTALETVTQCAKMHTGANIWSIAWITALYK